MNGFFIDLGAAKGDCRGMEESVVTFSKPSRYPPMRAMRPFGSASP